MFRIMIRKPLKYSKGESQLENCLLTWMEDHLRSTETRSSSEAATAADHAKAQHAGPYSPERIDRAIRNASRKTGSAIPRYRRHMARRDKDGRTPGRPGGDTGCEGES